MNILVIANLNQYENNRSSLKVLSLVRKLYNSGHDITLISVNEKYFSKVVIYTMNKRDNIESYNIVNYSNDIEDIYPYIESSDMIISSKKISHYDEIRGMIKALGKDVNTKCFKERRGKKEFSFA